MTNNIRFILLAGGPALSTEVVAKVDPEFLTAEDIALGLPGGASCRFAYTATSPAVLAVGEDAALMKISGDLVRLERQSEDATTAQFAAAPLSAEIRKRDALQDMIVAAGPDYHAGFRGEYRCDEGR